MPGDRVANLSKEVKSFLRRHKMAASRLGRDALKDSRIIGDLLAGKRRVFTTTAQKLLAWMDKWEKGNGDGRSKRQ